MAWPSLSLLITVILMGSQTGWCQIDAVTKARYDLKLGFTVDGKVVRIAVKPGESVKKGQLLMELYNEEEKSLVDLYELRASSDLEYKSTQAALRLARVEEDAIRKAFENDAAKPIEVERAQIRTLQTTLEVEMAQQNGKEAKLQLEQARDRYEEYLLFAPTDGVIDQVIVAEGELVETLKPVVRLVVTDPLWIDVAVPTEDTLNLKLGGPAWVRSYLPGHEEPTIGKIIHMALVADAASNTRLVRVEVPNPHKLPAGGQVTITFSKPKPETAIATPTHGSKRM